MTFALQTALFCERWCVFKLEALRIEWRNLWRIILTQLLSVHTLRIPLSAFTCLIFLLISAHSHLYLPTANGYTSARASPGLLTVSNGNSLGKVVPAKSPPPPHSPQMVNSRKPDLRVITSQGGKSLMQMVSLSKPNLCCLGPISEHF